MISNEKCYKEQLVDKKNKPKRAPLRNRKELAEEFGITLCALENLCTRHNPPEPVLIVKNSTTKRKVYWYDHQQMREWYKNYLVSKNKK